MVSLKPYLLRGESLKRIGRVLHVSPDRNIIVKAENLPRIGDRVVDELLKPIGRVFDIFGPSSGPYVAVKSRVKKPRYLVGQVLYIAPRTLK